MDMGNWWNVIRHPVQTRQNDNYRLWQQEVERADWTGNPPDAPDRDKAIAEFADWFPEVTDADRGQAGRGHEAHSPDWTFTGWVQERSEGYGWVPEDVRRVNALYPQDACETEVWYRWAADEGCTPGRPPRAPG